MNRILFAAGECDAEHRLVLRDRRAAHILNVLRPAVGATLRVGQIDGAIGVGHVEQACGGEVRLRIELNGAAPEPWIDLLLALPRPKVLGRLWAQLAAIGVGRIILVNAARVERYYFDTHWIEPGVYTPLLIEGLEQSGATRRPEVWIRRGFKPFIEDELDPVYAGAPRLLAHPGAPTEAPALPPPAAGAARPLLAVGPEGGWTEYECGQLERRGFRRLSLGPRTLRTDTACLALLGRLMPSKF